MMSASTLKLFRRAHTRTRTFLRTLTHRGLSAGRRHVFENYILPVQFLRVTKKQNPRKKNTHVLTHFHEHTHSGLSDGRKHIFKSYIQSVQFLRMTQKEYPRTRTFPHTHTPWLVGWQLLLWGMCHFTDFHEHTYFHEHTHRGLSAGGRHVFKSYIQSVQFLRMTKKSYPRTYTFTRTHKPWLVGWRETRF